MCAMTPISKKEFYSWMMFIMFAFFMQTDLDAGQDFTWLDAVLDILVFGMFLLATKGLYQARREH